MGMFGPQIFPIMGRKIGNQDDTGTFQHARHFRQDRFRMLCIMQDLMENDAVHRPIGQRQIVEIALFQFRFPDQIRSTGRLAFKQFRSRQPQHFGTVVDRDDRLGRGTEQLHHPPGPGPDIEHLAKWRVPQQGEHGPLHFCLGQMQRPDRIPFLCVGGKIAFRHFSAGLADQRKLRLVLHGLRGLGNLGRTENASQYFELGCWPGFQKDPAAFLAALCQPGFVQYSYMAGDARLTLIENLGKLANGQLHFLQQQHDSQPCRVGKCSKNVQDMVHDKQLYKEIFISGQSARF